MSNEERVLTLFEEANPVPDAHRTQYIDTEPAAYLATLQQRSSEMTELETGDPEQKTTRRDRWALAAAAAVVVVALGVLMVIINQGPEEPPVVTEPTPTTVTEQVTTTPSTIAEQSPTTTPSLELDERLNGSWVTGTKVLVFDDGSYSITIRSGEAGEIVDEGSYTIPEAGRMRMVSGGGVRCNNGDSRSMGYEFEGDTLIMRGGGDECLGRQNTLGREIVLNPSPTD